LFYIIFFKIFAVYLAVTVQKSEAVGHIMARIYEPINHMSYVI